MRGEVNQFNKIAVSTPPTTTTTAATSTTPCRGATWRASNLRYSSSDRTVQYSSVILAAVSIDVDDVNWKAHVVNGTMSFCILNECRHDFFLRNGQVTDTCMPFCCYDGTRLVIFPGNLTR